MPHLSPETLRHFVRQLFEAAGAPLEAAQLVSRTLVASNLAGHPSHGVVRAPQYLRAIENGDLVPTARPEITRETATTVLVDGRRGFGQVGANFAIQQAITRAQTHHLAAAGLFNANHVGRLTDWVEQATAHNLIGLAYCNGGSKGGLVTPHGSATRRLGTNPVAVGVPLADAPPFMMDFATSIVAEGKLRVARNQGKSLPEGWILDAEAQPSTDPNDFYAGGVLLPAAGYKGFGLSLACELLGGVLTGRGNPLDPDFATGNGVLFIVLDIEAFRPLDTFFNDAATFTDEIKAAAPREGFERVYLPGEPEIEAAAAQATTVELDEVSWQSLVEAADRWQIAVPSV